MVESSTAPHAGGLAHLEVSPDQLRELNADSSARGVTLVDTLAHQHHVPVDCAARWLAARFRMPFWTLQDMAAGPARLDLWPMDQALATQATLIQNAELQIMVLALTNPFDSDIALQAEQAAQAAVMPVVCTPDDLRLYLAQQETVWRAVDGLPSSNHTSSALDSDIEVLSLSQINRASSPAVRLVNSTLYDALRAGASDVHLETTPSGLAVRHRIDGVLDAVTELHDREVAEQAISRLKVLAELDIAERRVPQDGSFQVRSRDRVIDLRVSIMPSIHGEDAVIRILDKQAMIESHGQLSLSALGFEPAALGVLKALTEAAYGMLLVTGPTGSGKTTTLYAALAGAQTGRDKIITIEDPVEYQLPGILQIPVNEKKGLSFARGLRSVLRHDPDKIMVGEIRDRETAEIAVQSALTGHLVMTTVHANSVFDVFGRFTHMGLDPYTLASALNGIWAQRLIRVNCPGCSQPCDTSPHDWMALGLAQPDPPPGGLRRGIGCALCRGTGYRGRRAVAEYLILDDDIREMVVQRAPVRRIKEAARLKGTRSLQQVALDMVSAGLTTLEEVRRVTLAA